MNSDLLQSGLPPASDRMLTTCFVAALIHCIVILGVTFSSPNDAADGGDGAALGREDAAGGIFFQCQALAGVAGRRAWHDFGQIHGLDHFLRHA